MHHPQYSGDINSFANDIKDLTIENAKKLLIELANKNQKLYKSAKTSEYSVEQYKALISFQDGVQTKQNKDNNVKHISEIFLQLINSLNHFAYWITELIQKAYRDCDKNVEDICEYVNDLCNRLCQDCSTTRHRLYSFKITSSISRQENSEPEKQKEKLQTLDSNQDSKNKDDKNGNSLQNDGAKCDEKQGKSSLEPSTSFHENDMNEVSIEGMKSGLQAKSSKKSKVQKKRQQRLNYQNSESGDDKSSNLLQNNDTKCNEKQGKSTLKFSASTFESDKIEEIEKSGSIKNKKTCKEPEQKIEKLHVKSCLKPKKLLNKDKVEDSNIRQKTTVGSIGNNSVLNKPSNACENEGENNSLPHGVTSKRSRGYKRHHMPDNFANHVNEGENFAPGSFLQKRPCLSRKSHLPNMHGSDENVNALDEGKVNDSNNFSNVHGSDVIECVSSSDHKHFRGGNSFLTSETEAEDVASCEKPKRNKKGKKKKRSLMQQQEAKANFESSDLDENSVSFECDPNSISSSSKSGMTEPCVLLTNVLNDPNVQHYHDVIRYNEKMKTENNVARCKEKSEMEETVFNKDRNEIEASQEWNVLDAASDEEDKESDNTDCFGEWYCSNADRQESDSEVDGKESMNDVSGEQLENVSSNREELDDSVNREEHYNERSYCLKQYLGSNNSNSDSEMRMHERGYGPRTPPFHLKSDFGNCSKDNDADEPSNEDEDTSPRCFASDIIYGKKGPRTPPPLPTVPNESKRRGPHTPPGQGPEPEA